ncbi:hypothetical protein JZ751_008146 [Albula glossodonta]|uniref:Uncharacterized protein n=1 Tax=Albula glossodonta TaxID=121402 RepID=A0A8T2ND32_9TELE|nr:hypothetical protein JZ751_008146 [Albula glossodonta]
MCSCLGMQRSGSQSLPAWALDVVPMVTERRRIAGRPDGAQQPIKMICGGERMTFSSCSGNDTEQMQSWTMASGWNGVNVM